MYFYKALFVIISVLSLCYLYIVFKSEKNDKYFIDSYVVKNASTLRSGIKVKQKRLLFFFIVISNIELLLNLNIDTSHIEDQFSNTLLSNSAEWELSVCLKIYYQ